MIQALWNLSSDVIDGFIRMQWNTCWRGNANVTERLLRYDDRPPHEIFMEGFALHNDHSNARVYDWNLFNYTASEMLDTTTTVYV